MLAKGCVPAESAEMFLQEHWGKAGNGTLGALRDDYISIKSDNHSTLSRRMASKVLVSMQF
jgi:hypothetical protein